MIINGDSLEVLKTFDNNSIDAVVTDPPYGLSFMGKKWDYDVPSTELWVEVFRVLKPGGHLLAFAGTRTQHRMAVNIEDAGFEIRDMIAWVYGSGFPKSLNIGKAVDKLQGNKRKTIGTQKLGGNAALKWNDKSGKLYASTTNSVGIKPIDVNLTKGNSPYEGWGTALKPALEPITVARKPIKGTVANNVLEYGTGGINIDGCRVGTDDNLSGGVYSDGEWVKNPNNITGARRKLNKEDYKQPTGRFPANFIHDGSDEVVGLLNESARFFYCAKANKSERNKGLEGFEEKQLNTTNTQSRTWNDRCGNCGKKFIGDVGYKCECPLGEKITDKSIYTQKNNHPTVKPVKLMQYLVRLVTPKGGTILDPFNGSGTTGIACKLEGFDYIGIELDPEYCKISEARIDAWEPDKQEKLV
jgi:DNA modification methylase